VRRKDKGNHRLKLKLQALLFLMVGLMIVTPLFLMVSCGPAAGFSSLSRPTPIPQPVTKSFKTACTVTVAEIPPQHGEGWRWFQVSTTGSGCGLGPKWTITPYTASVFPWPEDNSIAYAGGQNGTYTVTATFEQGSGSIQFTINHS
jgi:hypothetical protein